MNNVSRELVKIAKLMRMAVSDRDVMGVFDGEGSKINFGRKLSSEGEINGFKTDVSKLSEEAQVIIRKKLDVYDIEDLFEDGEFSLDDLMQKTPQHFIIRMKNRNMVLVDTQGYSYARYATKLVNF